MSSNLDAFHRMEFYRNKKNWKFTRQNEHAETKVDYAGHFNIDTNTVPKESYSEMDINQTYDLEDETSPVNLSKEPEEDPDDALISSGIVEGDVSSVESEYTFVSGARLVPHSSTFSLFAPPPTPLEFPELDMMDIPSQNTDTINNNNVDTYLTHSDIVQHVLREQSAIHMHTQRLKYYLQFCRPEPSVPLAFPQESCQPCDQPFNNNFSSSVQNLLSLLDQPNEFLYEDQSQCKLPPFSDFSLRSRGRGREYFGT